MSDQGTRISASPSTSQSNRMVMRAIRLIVELRLWEIVDGVATGSPGRHRRDLIKRLAGRHGFIGPNTRAPRIACEAVEGFVGSELMFLQDRDAVGNVAVINVHRIDLAETIECGVGFTGHIER